MRVKPDQLAKDLYKPDMDQEIRQIQCVPFRDEVPPSAYVTFRTIDQANGMDMGNLKAEGWPLEIWFAGVYEMPIENFPLFDLARTCRQHSACSDYLPAVVPLCLVLLEQNPLAGEDYDDGELLSGVINLPASYWLEREEQRKSVEALAATALEIIDDDEDLKNKSFGASGIRRKLPADEEYAY